MNWCLQKACFILLALTLGGCATKHMSEKETEIIASSIYEIGMEQHGWKDNSLDAYSAEYVLRVNPSKLEEGFSYGGWNLVMSDTQTYILQKHLCIEDYHKAWDELITINRIGEIQRQKIILPFTPENNNQIVRIGRVWGNNDLLCANAEDGLNGPKWRIFELDENQEPKWDFVVEFLDDNSVFFPEFLSSDKEGYLHLVFRYVGDGQESKLIHYVVDKSGKVQGSLQLDEMENNIKRHYQWFLSEEGELLLNIVTYGEISGANEIYRLVKQTTLEKTLFSWEYKADGIGLNQCLFFLDDIMLYADSTGIYQCSEDRKEITALYEWQNHGIEVREILGLRMIKDGSIQVVFKDKDGDQLVSLSRTTEQVERKVIVLAVPQYRESYYRPIADFFNKEHPEYQVKLKTDYDETRLLTELLSGNGPVLIDTRLTGFEQQKELWEPLDEMLRDAGLNGMLFENVMKLCQIEGVTYGVTMDFEVGTVFVSEPDITEDNWTYDSFFRKAELRELSSIFPQTPGGNSQMTFVMRYLAGYVEDNYLINVYDTGNSVNLSNLKRTLDLADKYKQHDEISGYMWTEAFRNGNVLCKDAWIRGIDTITELKKEYGENIHFVGFPTSAGGKSFIGPVIPMAIRNAAPEEEKIIARAFLLTALSYEGQLLEMERNLNFGISIRKDIFEEQITREIEDYCDMIKADAGGGEEGDKIANLVKNEMTNDILLYSTLVNNATARNRLPQELYDIVYEEFSEYFAGDYSRELFTDHLTKRVRLYLTENYE